MSISALEQAKIQAQVLVPLIKMLQAELGEARANAIVRKALGGVYRRLGEQWWQTKGSSDVGEAMASAFAAFAVKVTPSTIGSTHNRKRPMRSMSRDAGTHSSTRS